MLQDKKDKKDNEKKHDKSYVLRFTSKALMEEAYSVMDSVWRQQNPAAATPTERKVTH